MTDSNKYRLMAAFVLATICLPAAAKDQNAPAARLKFEVAQRTVDWVSADMYGRSSRVSSQGGLVKPSHRAQLFIANVPYTVRSSTRYTLSVDFQGAKAIEKIIETPAGQKMSSAQREFLKAGRAIYREGPLGDEVADHFRFWVYGVSKEDAERTTQAFIQFLTAEAEANMQSWLSERKKLTEDSIPSYKKRVSEAEGEIKAVQTRLDVLKKSVHYVSTEEAMQTVLEFNKTLNTLEVDIAGSQAKVSANKEYMRTTNLTNNALTKLQEILAGHIIELAGALAKKETATKIRDQAKEFYDLHTQLTKLPKGLDNLLKALRGQEGDLMRAEERITSRSHGALPPKVFDNKVVINAVHTD